MAFVSCFATLAACGPGKKNAQPVRRTRSSRSRTAPVASFVAR